MPGFKTALIAFSLAGTLAFSQSPASSQPTAPAQSKATVYVYRYKQFTGSALAPSVYCDDAQVARIENGRYFAIKLDPGMHSFRSNDAQSGVQLELAAGQEYFIRVEIALGMLKGHGRLVLTAPEQGRYEVKSNQLKPLDAGKVVDAARVSTEEAKFDTPLPTQAAAAAPTKAPTVQPLPVDPPVREVTLSDQPSNSDSDTSLGDAARRARQKKAANTATSVPQ
jgi:hypothetical protein